REEALRSMTLWPAFAAFQENELGSIVAGKYADFTILDRDIMKIAPEKILSAQVVATYVGGTPVYQAKSTAATTAATAVGGSSEVSESTDATSMASGAHALPIEREDEWTRGLVARD